MSDLNSSSLKVDLEELAGKVVCLFVCLFVVNDLYFLGHQLPLILFCEISNVSNKCKQQFSLRGQPEVLSKPLPF